MAIYIDKRKLKDGTYVYRFTTTDKDGKRVRLPQETVPRFTNYEEALAWAKSQDGHDEAMKARIAEKLAWREKYYQFDELLEKYIVHQKLEAPNSWKNNIHHLEQHIFPYFLEDLKCNNVNMWPIHFEAFKDHIQTIKSMKGRLEDISWSTRNHIIRTLNTFLKFLKKKNLMDRSAFELCEAFPKKLVKKRTWEDVITPEELIIVRSKLAAKDSVVAEFFYVLWHTGMRANEAYGLCLAFLYSGKPGEEMGMEIDKLKLNCYGYIILESQPKNKKKKRKADGTIPRKPLKTKDSISPENNRIIPITDRDCWNILARRHKAAKKEYDTSIYGLDKRNYLLFEGIDLGRGGNILNEVYDELKIRPKTFHCCRHSKATYLIGETKSYFLAKAVLGHSSDVIHDYVHTFAMISNQAKQNDQVIEEIDDDFDDSTRTKLNPA